MTQQWRKSSRSAEETNCVELARDHGRIAHLRDSKNPTGPMLNANMAELLDAVKSGRLSH